MCSFLRQFIPILAVFTQPDAANAQAPDPHERARALMVEQQLAAPGRNIRNTTVLKAMREVPRHEFFPAHLRAAAHDDHPAPIGHGQTISQPYIVGLMSDLLDPKPGDRMLEVGTGSGYQAAVLAAMGVDVYSVEIVPELARQAEATLKRLGYDRVRVREGDGYRGWPEHAPFSGIIVTCSPAKIPMPLVEQLAKGGRMVIPVGDEGGQELYLLRKGEDGKMSREKIIPVRFVPMTGEVQKTSE